MGCIFHSRMNTFRQASCSKVLVLLASLAANLNFVSTTGVQEDKQCQPWFIYNTATGNCECVDVNMIYCMEQDVYLTYGYCATYDKDLQLAFIAECPYFQSRGFHINVTQPGCLLLPNNYSELNKFMCNPMSRKGFVCSDCKDHYGPSVTSYGYECPKCANSWQGILLYLLIEFLPVTLLYLVILIFQIDLVTPPIPCFIMYSQLVYSGLQFYAVDVPSAHQVMFTEDFTLRLGTKLLLTFCGIMNLDFFQYFLPAFCVSNRLKLIHLVSLSYLKAFYPLLLIFLTSVCIKLHDRNFRLFVCLWRPFHRCFQQLRKGWNTKNSIINVFCSFLLLSYGKCLYQTILLVNCQCLSVISEHAVQNRICRALPDVNIDCWGAKHMFYTIPALLVLLVCNIIPTFLLVLYPLKAFHVLTSRHGLHRVKAALHQFTIRFHCYYKDVTVSKYDMRWCSGLYFFLMVATNMLYLVTRHFVGIYDYYFTKGIMFWAASLVIATIKPYNKGYMNILDSLLLAHLGILCSIMTLPSSGYFGSHYVLVVQLLCLIPFAVLFLYLAKRVSVAIYRLLRQQCNRLVKSDTVEQQLLTHPHRSNTTRVSYGTH